METIPIFFTPVSWMKLNPIPPSGFTQILNVHTTYEKIIGLLLQKGYLSPLNPPQEPPDLWTTETYRVLLGVYNRSDVKRQALLTKYMQAGDTLASTNLITDETVFLACEGFITNRITTPSQLYYPRRGMEELLASNRAKTVAQEVDVSQAKQEPNTSHPSLDETISGVVTMATNILIFTASIATIIQTLIVVQERWEKTHHPHKAGPPQHFPQPKKTDIYAIRLRMTDGREHTQQKWLTEPSELKHFIDVFLQPSSKVKPAEVVFVLWNRETIVVDVREGAQGNLQLDEMLKYLKNGQIEK